MDPTSGMQYEMYFLWNITDGLLQTIFHAPAECWCTEMEQIPSPPKRFTASQKPLSAGATNKLGEWPSLIHIISTNIDGKIRIFIVIKTWSKLSGIHVQNYIYPVANAYHHVMTFIISYIYIYIYIWHNETKTVLYSALWIFGHFLGHCNLLFVMSILV